MGIPQPPRDGTQLTPRDLSLLAWGGEHGVFTARQAAARWWNGSAAQDTAWRRIRKLVALGVIQRHRAFWREAGVLTVTRRGLRLADVDIGPAEVILPTLRHSLAVVDLVEQLRIARPDAQLITERQMHADQWRARAAHGRIPDALVRLDGALIAVELDLTPKRSRKLREIIEAYTTASWHHERYRAVWWYVPQGTAARLQELVVRASADDFIEVRVWNP